MTFVEAVLTVLLALEPWYQDKAEVGRHERMTTIAIAITTAAHQTPSWKRSPEELAAFLVMQGMWESRFNRRVHAGQCAKDECDPSRRRGLIVWTSRSVWQLKQGRLSAEAWAGLSGLELGPTTNAALLAAERVSEAHRRCGSARGSIIGYARGRCDAKFDQTEMRLGTYERVLAVIRRNQAFEKKANEGVAMVPAWH
jgi:hypothetical protein